MVKSHTGALVRDSEVLAAFLRRCGIVQVESYDTFVEQSNCLHWRPGTTSSLIRSLWCLAVAGVPRSPPTLSTARAYHSPRLLRRQWSGSTSRFLDFGSVNNPLDGTGSIYDNPELLPALMDAVLANPGNAAIACAISAGTSTEQMLRIADTFADAAKTSGRTVLAYQPQPAWCIFESRARE